MSRATSAGDSFTDTLAETARRNIETTLATCDAFRRWHREKFVLRSPTPGQVVEHATDIRMLLLMLRWLQATVADPASPARDLVPRVEAMIRVLEDCWRYVHEPMADAEAEKLLADVFPGLGSAPASQPRKVAARRASLSPPLGSRARQTANHPTQGLIPNIAAAIRSS